MGARYYTPSGRSIQATGIEPDIIIEDAKVTKNGQGEDRLKEADLTRHLEGSNEEKTTDKKNKEKTTEKKSTADDFQLSEALTLLKGINIYTKKGS